MLHHYNLPAIAEKLEPTIRDYEQVHAWYKHASDKQKKLYAEKRLAVVAAGERTHVGCKAMKSSGSTGVAKNYRWGPNCLALDVHFHNLVRQGSRLDKTAWVRVVSIGKNPFNLVQCVPFEFFYADKLVNVNLYEKDKIVELKKKLSGYNVLISCSDFSLLEEYVKISEDFDRDAVIMFTWEPLEESVRNSLRSQGFDVRDYMRCWDGGASFYTCMHGNKHWVNYLADVRVVDEKLLASDYFNVCMPYIDYWNGDCVNVQEGEICSCGYVSMSVVFVNRRNFRQTSL